MRPLLLSLILVLASAPAAAAQAVAERAADSLASGDPVYVDPDAEFPLTAAEERALEARVPDGVYLAVLPGDLGGPRDAALGRIADALGDDDVYGFLVGNVLLTRGPGASEARDAARGENPRDAAEYLGAFVENLDESGGGAGGGGGSGIGAFVLLGALGAGGAALVVRRRRRRRAEQAEFAEVKDNARDDLVALGEDIRALDLDIEMPGVPAQAREHYARTVEAYERADSAWEVARTPDDLEPVGAALEQGRYEMSCAKAILEGRAVPEHRPPCFFDPRHGPSSREVEWAPEYGEPRLVPACEADAQRVERGQDPEAREVVVGGQRVPYWNAGPMYAPFAGGFFGGGLLPGLMIGTMLGSSFGWGAGDAYASGGDFGGGDFGGGDFGGGGFGGGDF